MKIGWAANVGETNNLLKGHFQMQMAIDETCPFLDRCFAIAVLLNLCQFWSVKRTRKHREKSGKDRDNPWILSNNLCACDSHATFSTQHSTIFFGFTLHTLHSTSTRRSLLRAYTFGLLSPVLEDTRIDTGSCQEAGFDDSESIWKLWNINDLVWFQFCAMISMVSFQDI